MKDKRFRFGMIGLGTFAPYLARQLVQVADLTAICDPVSENCDRFIKDIDCEVQTYADHQSLLAQADIDAVAITGPNFIHKEVTIAAAEAGKHVFCEKPMAVTVPDCWDMVRACDEADVRLMIGHKRSLRPPWTRMLELREDLGPVSAISVRLYHQRGEVPPWWDRKDRSGGTLFVAGIHLIDWMRTMCGEVASVRALAAPQQGDRFDFPDTLHVWLRFRSGALGSLDVSLVFPGVHYRDSGSPLVVCREGGIRFLQHKTHNDLYWQRHGEPEPHWEHFDDLGHDYAYRKELRDFVYWATEDKQPCLTWREGLRCVEVIEAAHRSAEQDGQSVELPLYPELEPSEG